ncbi:MAG: NAD+ synthase [Bacteroidales bacterium]|nr:NAD+ synthase [Bacteroidales bacterium]
MRIALAQLNYTIGDFEQNREKIIEVIRHARNQQVDLVVFAELSICGYPPRDFLEFSDFIERCEFSVQSIADECKGIAAIVGSPSHNPDIKGKNLLNSAFLLSDGKIIASAHKTLLPTYDIFDEYRYFESNKTFEVIEFKGLRMALTICEDLWNIGPDPLYVIAPMEALSLQHPDIIINIAASPFTWGQEEERNKVLNTNASNYKIPLIYVNHVGAQTELLFDGNSKVLDETGQIIHVLSAFKEDFRIVDFDTNTRKFPDNSFDHQISKTEKSQLIHDALVMGIHDYFKKMGFSKAILGLSGGIDSAVTLCLAAEALGPENVRAVLLPSRYSSDHSIADARSLALNLKTPHEVISIEESFQSFVDTLSPQFKDLPFNIAEENIQARVRAVILMALANKFGFILLNTSNKSEAAVGYGTLYGDMCGGISVLGDVYKTEVYELANYINRNTEIIPWNSISKPPSAELRPDQKDSDSLPEYGILDQILYQYIELRKGPAELIKLGFEENTVRRILRMVNMNEWKRHQTPPILRVSPKAFGSGRRMPIVAKYLS